MAEVRTQWFQVRPDAVDDDGDRLMCDRERPEDVDDEDAREDCYDPVTWVRYQEDEQGDEPEYYCAAHKVAIETLEAAGGKGPQA